MFAVAGRDGLLPTVSGFVHFKRLTPVVPIIIEGTLGKFQLWTGDVDCSRNGTYTILGILYVLVGDADRLLGYLSFSTWLVCLGGAMSVLVFRRTMPDAPRPVHAGIVAPVVFIVAMTVLTLVNMIYNPFDILVGIVILLSGLPVYWLFVLHRPASLEQFSRSVLVYLQKLLLVIPPVLPSDNEKQADWTCNDERKQRVSFVFIAL